jgi:hypothetical protein
MSVATVVERAAERWREQAEQKGHRLEFAGSGDPQVRASAGDVETMVDNPSRTR